MGASTTLAAMHGMESASILRCSMIPSMDYILLTHALLPLAVMT